MAWNGRWPVADAEAQSRRANILGKLVRGSRRGSMSGGTVRSCEVAPVAKIGHVYSVGRSWVHARGTARPGFSEGKVMGNLLLSPLHPWFPGANLDSPLPRAKATGPPKSHNSTPPPSSRASTPLSEPLQSSRRHKPSSTSHRPPAPQP